MHIEKLISDEIRWSSSFLDEDKNACDFDIDDKLLDSNGDYAFGFDVPSWYAKNLKTK